MQKNDKNLEKNIKKNLGGWRELILHLDTLIATKKQDSKPLRIAKKLQQLPSHILYEDIEGDGDIV